MKNPIVSCAIGFLFFAICFPFYILNPTFVDWLFHAPSPAMSAMDLHPHYLGWYFLRFAPTSFPLGSIPNFGAPAETFIAYTDSIPLLAFSFRMISDWLPQNFQYLGLWVLVCCILQGYFSGRILSRWVKDPMCWLAGVLLVTISPVLIWRWTHIALMSHWLLLWSLDLVAEFYFARVSNKTISIPVIRPIIIISLAVLIQPYLAAMVAGICWALPLTDLVDKRMAAKGKTSLFKTFEIKDFRTIFFATGTWVLFMLSVLFVFGFFKGDSRGEGFHWFGTDLLSLFNNHGTSQIIPAFRRKAGLSEGYAWPGLGGWFLFVAVLLPKIRNQYKEYFRNPHLRALVGVCGFMWFFALSERTYIGTFWLIDMSWFWNPFKAITSSLRTCGRFIWPGYYLMMLGSIILVSKFYVREGRGQLARGILFGAICLQLLDIGPWIFAKSSRYIVHGRQELKDQFWKDLPKQYKHFKLIPPSLENGPCYSQKSDYWYEWAEFANYAASHNMSVNSGFFARYDRLRAPLACGAEWFEFLKGPLHEDSIYIVRRGYDDGVVTRQPDRQCREIDGYMICLANAKQGV